MQQIRILISYVGIDKSLSSSSSSSSLFSLYCLSVCLSICLSHSFSLALLLFFPMLPERFPTFNALHITTRKLTPHGINKGHNYDLPHEHTSNYFKHKVNIVYNTKQSLIDWIFRKWRHKHYILQQGFTSSFLGSDRIRRSHIWKPFLDCSQFHGPIRLVHSDLA